MCAIIGINGNFSSDDVNVMIKTLHHRGPDGFGIYDNNVIYDQFLDDKVYADSLVLGHNLLSIVGNNELQPIRSDNLLLVANAEIYNYDYLMNCYDFINFKTKSDCEIILKVIGYHYEKTGNLKDAVLSSIDELDGDYAFCITDGVDYIVIRDRMGVKPLYYTINDDFFAFASEQKALKEITGGDIFNLNPRLMIYNDEIIRIRDDYKRFEDNDIDYYDYRKLLKDSLIESVSKRVKNLDRVALLFSGGIDSTIIAYILKMLDVNVCAYTVGTENSQDLKFAKKVSQNIGMPLKYKIINKDDVAEYFEDTIKSIEDTNLMKIGVGMTVNMTSRLALKDNHKVILSGQGADELFCGYNRYKNKYDTPDKLLEELTQNLNQMYEVNLERDDKACMNNSIELRVPYLDKDLINITCKLPIKHMLHSDDDNIRKHILRDIALQLGVPAEIAQRPKKAAQYATGIDKIIKKKLLKDEKYRQLLEINN